MDKIRAIVKSSPFIITLIYIIVGAIWISYSDRIVLSMFQDPNIITQVQSYKGWFYVFASGILIFFLIYQSNLLIEQHYSEAKKERDKFEATFKSAPIGIAHHKPNEKWILVNQRLCQLLGYNKNDLLNLKFDAIIHEDDIHEGRRLDNKICRGEISSYKMEKTFKRKNGTLFTGKVTKAAVFNEQNEVQYLIALLEDISHQKEHEKELKESLEQKELLLSEVHHRVKNNIALMSALLELQTMYSNSSILIEVLDHYKTRLKSLSLIYENFNEIDKEINIDFKWFLNEQINYLNRVLDIQTSDIRYQKNIQKMKVNINQAIPLGLICNEMLIHTNNQRFKDIEKPFITVNLTERNGEITFSVENNGKSNKKRSTINDPNSLDERIMSALLKQINGEVSFVENESSKTYKVVFKKKTLKGGASHFHSINST